jgi:hypothetical protein
VLQALTKLVASEYDQKRKLTHRKFALETIGKLTDIFQDLPNPFYNHQQLSYLSQYLRIVKLIDHSGSLGPAISRAQEKVCQVEALRRAKEAKSVLTDVVKPIGKNIALSALHGTEA